MDDFKKVELDNTSVYISSVVSKKNGQRYYFLNVVKVGKRAVENLHSHVLNQQELNYYSDYLDKLDALTDNND